MMPTMIGALYVVIPAAFLLLAGIYSRLCPIRVHEEDSAMVNPVYKAARDFHAARAIVAMLALRTCHDVASRRVWTDVVLTHKAEAEKYHALAMGLV